MRREALSAVMEIFTLAPVNEIRLMARLRHLNSERRGVAMEAALMAALSAMTDGEIGEHLALSEAAPHARGKRTRY